MSSRYLSSFSVIIVFIALSLLGCALLPLLPVKLSPSESLPTISVSFSMTGSSARTVESEATSKLESALSRVKGIKSVESRSSSGSANIRLEFDRNTDISTARFEIAMIVRQLWSSLPQNVTYPQVAVSAVNDESVRPFISYTVNAPLTPPQIMSYTEKNIRTPLLKIPGVAKVDLSGAMPMEWQIEYDSNELNRLGLSPQTITAAIADHLGAEFLGVAPTGSGEGWVRLTVGMAGSSDSLKLSEIVVNTQNDHIITLDKIATARRAEALPSGYFRINGLSSIYLNITAAENVNQVDLSEKIKKVLADIQLPEGFMLNLSYDSSERISSELDKIYLRSGLTVLILLAFVGLITLSWRYLMLITISLAFNMAIAVVAYYLLGVEIQLYSLAGITISLNLIIDNLIVMTEHITRRHNLKAFTAVLAATATTTGALSVVFFLDERTMLNLKDFVVVVIVNLAVSLLVALFLVPALIERLHVVNSPKRKKHRKLPLILSRVYASISRFCLRHRVLVYIAMILIFGLPVFALPTKVEGESAFDKAYNATFGSDFYNNRLREWVDCCLGGTLRLFADKVTNGSYWNNKASEPIVSINATLPNGATLAQMEALISKMERFIATQEGVRQFQTQIMGGRRASISVYFTPEAQHSGLPYRFKNDAISKALTLGGGSWSVYGLQDNGFNNDVRESAGFYRIRIRGYNYDDLYSYATVLRDSLQTHRRIRDVSINSKYSYYKDDYTEFYLVFDKSRLIADSLSVGDIYGAFNKVLGHDMTAGSITSADGSETVRMSSSGRGQDVWAFMNIPIEVGRRQVKIADYATIERQQTPPDVVKYNQEYVLCLQFEYVGSNLQADKIVDRLLEKFNARLPIGYHAVYEKSSWSNENSLKQYLLLVLIALIIFFISSILFNSLRQPLAIIAVIPVSFTGVFLTFYFFELKFDQGGFAAFVLLCGITVNAAIYIINEYNSLRWRWPRVDASMLYFRAFRAKITAVMLTVLSTVLGFIPFVIGQDKENFWFPLAAGTMGGLVMSLLAIFILLPILILPRKRKLRMS